MQKKYQKHRVQKYPEDTKRTIQIEYQDYRPYTHLVLKNIQGLAQNKPNP